jgi:hypothetical protein
MNVMMFVMIFLNFEKAFFTVEKALFCVKKRFFLAFFNGFGGNHKCSDYKSAHLP